MVLTVDGIANATRSAAVSHIPLSLCKVRGQYYSKIFILSKIYLKIDDKIT